MDPQGRVTHTGLYHTLDEPERGRVLLSLLYSTFSDATLAA